MVGKIPARIASFAIAAAMTVGVMAAPAQAWDPTPGAQFNVPYPWGSFEQKYRLVHEIEDAIRATPAATPGQPKPIIAITSYLFDRKISVDALVAACKRGVSVRVILDGEISNRQASRLVRTLNADNVKDTNDDGVADTSPVAGPCNSTLNNRAKHEMTRQEMLESVTFPGPKVTWGGDQSYVKICEGGCRRPKGFMHSKFYIFSQTGSASNVVMISSGNLNVGAAQKGWNDLYTMVEEPDTFAEYARIHRLMTDEVPATPSGEQFSQGPYLHRFYPMPGAGQAQDPVLADLNQISCDPGPDRTQVHVEMFYWGQERGTWLGEKLIALGRDGCDVNIIVGAPTIKWMKRLRSAAKAGSIDLWDSRWDFNPEPGPDTRVHGKLFMVNGTYAGEADVKMVSIGSVNWVTNALTAADENSLNIELDSVYNDYLANFEKVRAKSRRVRG